MKSFFFVLSLLCVTLCVKAQYYEDVLSYYNNGLATNGIKIKTKLPFTSASQLPTLLLEGYNYTTGETINLTLAYNINGSVFNRTSVSSSGAINPAVSLAAENGKVVIFIDLKTIYQRLHVRAYSNGWSAETAINFTGWTAVDSTINVDAVATALVPYVNRFSGNVYLPGNNIINSTGSLGIGTQAPRAPIDVAVLALDTTTAVLGRLNEGNTTGAGTSISVHAYNSQPINSLSFALEHKFYGNLNSAVNFYRGLGPTGGFLTFSTNNGTERMRIDVNGNVGIGTTAPGSNKLAVEGTIGARKLQIQQTTWADFVFEKKYQLSPLYEVADYISTNKHLPGIPTAEQVQKEGIDVGEMNKLLLQKVEELTLYIISLQQQVDQLKASKN